MKALLEPVIYFPVLGTIAALCLAWALRQLHIAMTTTHEQRVNEEAQRRMLRFCKNPTKRNYISAWNFIGDEGVMLGDLDWPLVQRFSSMAVKVNFSPEVGS